VYSKGMTPRKSPSPTSLSPPPCPPPPDPSTLHPVEEWYLRAFKLLSAWLRRSPTALELATYTGRQRLATYKALQRIEARGHLARDVRGRFKLPDGGPGRDPKRKR